MLPVNNSLGVILGPQLTTMSLDVNRIIAKNPLRLMDVLFSKEEMASSLLFESKSTKPPLDKDRVDTMLDLVEKSTVYIQIFEGRKFRCFHG